MDNALYILAATSSTTHTAPAPMLLVVYIIWCWRRTPSPGSTRALDGWAGFLSANLCVIGFWMKRRWALGFLWLAIWAVVIGIQRILAANVQFETQQAVTSFNTISIISLVLMGWTTGIVALKTPRLAVDVQLPTPRPVDLITVKTLDKKEASVSTAAHQPPPQQPPTQPAGPAQIPLVSPNTARPSFEAPESAHVSSQKRKTGALIFLLCALGFCAVVILFFRPWEKYQTPPMVAPEIRKAVPVENKATVDFSPLPEKPLTPAEIFRRVRPSVVLLTMQDVRGQPISLGTGFFVDPDVVATNFHVIEGAAGGYAKIIGAGAKLTVKGTVGVDALHDLALLEVDPSATTPLVVASRFSANIGDTAFAIGNPQGLEGTISQGIISSLRAIGSDRLVQITTPISPGSSGGPVLDESGTVIGVSFASIERGQNLNFAIPCDYLAALQLKRAELRPFTAVPRAKARTTLLDRIGNDRPLAGVVGENLIWDDGPFVTGNFSFSIHNKLRDNISRTYVIAVFYDVQGQPIDVYPIQYSGVIPAGTAKRVKGSVDPSVEQLNSTEPRDEPRRSQGKVEFRILDFNIE